MVATKAPRSNDNQNSSGLVHEAGNQQFGFMQTSLGSWYFYENVWQMQYEALRNCSCQVHRIPLLTVALTKANHAAAWAGHTWVMRSWHHVPRCRLAGWLQLCSGPNSHSCAPPASPEKECSRETHTHTAHPGKLKLLYFGCKQTLSVPWGGR